MTKRKIPLRTLQARLRGLQTTFTNLYSFMGKYTETTRPMEVTVRLNTLDSLWDQMNEAIDEIVAHEDTAEDPEAFVKDRVDFENQFFTLKTFLLEKSQATQTTPSTSSANTAQGGAAPQGGFTPHVRLPQITLPKFSGKLDEWLTFRDLYTSLIHWQVELPAVEKFHYLRSQLEGEALAVIDSLPLTAANYNVAWDLLTQRYTNSKFLRKRQVQALFELPAVKKESSSELHVLLESFEKIIKSLDRKQRGLQGFVAATRSNISVGQHYPQKLGGAFVQRTNGHAEGPHRFSATPHKDPGISTRQGAGTKGGTQPLQVGKKGPYVEILQRYVPVVVIGIQ